MAVLYAGSLLSLFVTSLYTLSEDGAHIEHTLSADNYREILDEPRLPRRRRCARSRSRCSSP